MTKMGMDVDAVENVGRQLKQTATSVDSLVGSIDKTVSSLTGAWDGPDAQRFVQQSWPMLRKALIAAQSSVVGLGQSALNNAAEQREASGAGPTAGGGGSSVLPVVPSHIDPAPSKPAPQVGSSEVGSLPFEKSHEQSAYDAWRNDASIPKTKGLGWCTSWVEFRRHEIDPSLSVPRGNGGQMAPPSSLGPSLGAIVSFPADRTSDFSVGHVGVVEQLQGTDPRTFVISEMNAGEGAVFSGEFGNGRVDKGRTFTEQQGGGWKDSNGMLWPELRFLP